MVANFWKSAITLKVLKNVIMKMTWMSELLSNLSKDRKLGITEGREQVMNHKLPYFFEKKLGSRLEANKRYFIGMT